jgi:hypothetical protein
MTRWMFWLLGLSLAGLAWQISLPGPLFPPQPLFRPEGMIVAPDPPTQRMLEGAPAQPYHDLSLQPLAEFEFDARLISLAWYAGGVEARYSPVDLGIGWGRMSDSAHLDALEWRHGTRFLNYRYANAPPIPQPELNRSIANLHVLPASEAVLRQIEALRPGQRIVGRGTLVAARRDDGWNWTSSLRRDDTGAGACELILLSEIYALP